MLSYANQNLETQYKSYLKTTAVFRANILAVYGLDSIRFLPLRAEISTCKAIPQETRPEGSLTNKKFHEEEQVPCSGA